MEAEIIAGIASALSPIFEDVWDGLKKTVNWSNKNTWGRSRWKDAAREYGKKLQLEHGTIQILSQPEPKPLGKIYTDVYLHDRPTANYAMSIKELEEDFQNKNRFGRKERYNGLKCAIENPRLFILGKPGAGKTTFLKYLAIQVALGKIINKIPVFVNLNDLAHKKQSIKDYLVSRFEMCNFPDAESFIEFQLQKGNMFVLFDGLDEVGEKRRGANPHRNPCADLQKCRVQAPRLRHHRRTASVWHQPAQAASQEG